MENTDLRVFDKAAFGVFRADLDGRIDYANEWLNAVLGKPLVLHSTLGELVSDTESANLLEEELRRRRQGYVGDYVLTVNTPTRPLKLQIYGTPMWDHSGNYVGSVAFVTRAALDALHHKLSAIRIPEADPQAALDEIRQVLESYYSFDAFTVAMYDARIEYSRVLYSHFSGDAGGGSPWSKHWVKLTTEQRQWILDSDTSDRAIADLDEFMRRPEWQNLSGDRMVRALREYGIRSAAGVVVRDGDTIVASISLFSRRPGAYDEEIVCELHRLPLDRRVFAVVNALRRAEMSFRYSALRQLVKCNKIHELANSVANLLCSQYKLARVALYSIDWTAQHARLEAERCSGKRRSRAETVIALTDGVMGQVARTGKAQYLEDLSIEAEFRQQVGEESGSAYCWPVSYYRNGGDRLVRWVFVAVDERLAAFSPGERYSLNEVAGDIGGLLRGLNTLHFLRSTFDTTSDAILVVDSLNQVRRANQSAADLFGQDHPRKLVGHLGSFFGSPDEAEPFLSRRAYSRESQVMDAAGKTFPAMVTSRAMPVSIGGKVLAFEDLRSIRRLEELGFLGRVTAEVSVQMQTPLTLASSWMQRIRAFTTDSESREGAEESTVIRDLADRAAVQLRRIQGCLDRIAFFDAKDAFVPRPAIPVSLNDELLRLLGTLPASERDRIDVPNPAQRVVVRVHPEHLGFVLDTLLGFFLRDLPSADKVAVETGRDTQFGWLFCEVYRQAEKNKQAASVKATPLATELGLARRALTQIISGYGGSYETQQAPSDGRIAGVRIALPLCE